MIYLTDKVFHPFIAAHSTIALAASEEATSSAKRSFRNEVKSLLFICFVSVLRTYIVLDVIEAHVLRYFRHTNPRSPGQPPPPPPQSNTYAHRHVYQQELQQYNNQVYFSVENIQYFIS